MSDARISADCRNVVTRRRTAGFALLALAGSLLGAALYLSADAAGADHAWAGLPLDDSWIHLVYGRSIAAGRPFQYNPGEWETGATSPLWALLLAPALALGIPAVAGAKLLGILCTAGAAVAGARVLCRLGEAGAAAAFALLFPLIPYFAFTSVAGTEVPLFVALLFGVLEAALAERPRRTGLLAGLAILARPEGYLLLPLLAVAHAVAASRRHGEQGRRVLAAAAAAVRGVAPALLVVSPWIAYCLWATGRPLPSTFYVKSLWLGVLNVTQLGRIADVGLWQPFLAASPAPLLAWTGAAAGLAALAAGVLRLRRESRAALAVGGLFPWVFFWALSTEVPLGPVGHAISAGSVRTFYFARYLLPGVALLALLWFLGVAWLARQARAGGHGRRAVLGTTLALAGAYLALPVAAAWSQHRELREVYSWNCRNIDEINVAAGLWLAANLPEGAAIGVSDAGAIRWFAERRVVDLAGLNSHRLVPLLRELDRLPPGAPRGTALRERFWHGERLRYLAITRDWHRALLAGRTVRLLRGFQMERNTIYGGVDMLVLEVAPALPPSR